MIAVGALAKAIVTTLVATGVHGTIVVVAALALARAGRLRPAWEAAVWLVAVAAFALPWAPALPWSIADVLAALAGGDADPRAPLALAPVGGDAIAASSGTALAWIVLALAWLGGAALVLVRALAGQRAAWRAASGAADAPVHARLLVPELAARARIVVGERATGPHVVGIARPIVVVPPALVARPELLAAALRHELAHVRRRDALARVVEAIAVALFWFWPVVRAAARRLDRAREAACDAYALASGELAPPAYARLLVDMAALRAPAPALAAPRALDARVAAVLGPPPRPVGVARRAALVGWVALALGGGRAAADRGDASCNYTPELARALYASHPEADRDGDGTLSREEACALQAELRDRPLREVSAAELALLRDPLCCNLGEGDGVITAPVCRQAPGVIR